MRESRCAHTCTDLHTQSGSGAAQAELLGCTQVRVHISTRRWGEGARGEGYQASGTDSWHRCVRLRVRMHVCMQAGPAVKTTPLVCRCARAHACLRASMDISMRRRLSERRVYACTCVRRTGCRNRAARPRGGVQTREPACLTRSACTHGQACLSETTCPRR